MYIIPKVLVELHRQKKRAQIRQKGRNRQRKFPGSATASPGRNAMNPTILRALRALIAAQLRQGDYLSQEEVNNLKSSLAEIDDLVVRNYGR